MYQKGLLVVVSGPSGTGKGTLLKLIKENRKNIRFSVSATTRKPRINEVDGVDYFFKTPDEFKEMIAKDELFEWVEYCDNFYGTPKKYIEESMEHGNDVILEIEVEGALKVMNQYPECISLFILPPSFDELKRRIESRGTEAKEVIEKRLAKAKKEVTFAKQYEYCIINDNLKEAVGLIDSILMAEKHKFKRNSEVLKNLGIIE